MERNIFAAHVSNGIFTPLFQFRIPELKGNSACKACDGEGSHFCAKCKDSHSCSKCSGSGEVSEDAVRVTIGRHEVSHLLLNQIKGLPNVCIAENATSDEQGLTFMFDGGDGILMPMKKGDESQ